MPFLAFPLDEGAVRALAGLRSTDSTIPLGEHLHEREEAADNCSCSPSRAAVVASVQEKPPSVDWSSISLAEIGVTNEQTLPKIGPNPWC